MPMNPYTEIYRADLTDNLVVRHVTAEGSLATFCPGPCYVFLRGHPTEAISVYPVPEFGKKPLEESLQTVQSPAESLTLSVPRLAPGETIKIGVNT